MIIFEFCFPVILKIIIFNIDYLIFLSIFNFINNNYFFFFLIYYSLIFLYDDQAAREKSVFASLKFIFN